MWRGRWRRGCSRFDEVTVVERLAVPGAEAPAIRLVSEDPALIQYTSGSTGEPKGVLLSHANIMANIRAIARGIAIGPDDVAVSWLPLYHDMGLIGSWLATLSFGIPIVILSPLSFLARPARWLWALHAHRGTLSAAPNFAFELCVRKVADEEIRGLDLERLAGGVQRRRAGEPGHDGTLHPPVRALWLQARGDVPGLRPGRVHGGPDRAAPHARPVGGACGPGALRAFRRGAPASPDHPNPLRFVSCGRAFRSTRCGSSTSKAGRCANGSRAGVQFRGPSVTAGYFRNPEATRAVLEDGWMDSGDLGYLAEGRAVHHRPAEGPDHQGGPQPLPAGGRGGRRRHPGDPQGLRRRLRRRRDGDRNGTPGRRRREPADEHRRTSAFGRRWSIASSMSWGCRRTAW